MVRIRMAGSFILDDGGDDPFPEICRIDAEDIT